MNPVSEIPCEEYSMTMQILILQLPRKGWSASPDIFIKNTGVSLYL